METENKQINKFKTKIRTTWVERKEKGKGGFLISNIFIFSILTCKNIILPLGTAKCIRRMKKIMWIRGGFE